MDPTPEIQSYNCKYKISQYKGRERLENGRKHEEPGAGRRIDPGWIGGSKIAGTDLNIKDYFWVREQTFPYRRNPEGLFLSMMLHALLWHRCTEGGEDLLTTGF